MSAGVIIAIVIGAIIVIALVTLIAKRQQARRLEQRHVERDQHRDEARIAGAWPSANVRPRREVHAARRQAAQAEERRCAPAGSRRSPRNTRHGLGRSIPTKTKTRTGTTARSQAGPTARSARVLPQSIDGTAGTVPAAVAILAGVAA